MKHLLLFSLLLLAKFSAAQSVLDSILHDFHHRPERILVAAHRAAHQHYPENSLASIKEAIRLGVDIVELDLRETKDGVLIIMHDKTIDRTTTGKGVVSDLTYLQLKEFFLLHNGEATTEKIPTFQEAIDAAKGKVMIDLDYKASGKRALKNTLRAIKKNAIESQLLYFLYDYTEAPVVHKKNKKIQILARAYDADQIRAIFKMPYNIPAVHGDDQSYDESLMQQIRLANKRVWMNALNKFDKEQKANGTGFDQLLKFKQTNIIQTDLPEELLHYLREKALRRP